MTRIDFYVLGELRLDAREPFVARLACKAFRSGRRVFVRVADADAAERLDAVLWEQPADAFLPHARQGAPGEQDAPVVIGTDATHTAVHDVLINLGEGIPDGFASFDRIAEIVIDDERERAAARERYRHYRDRGYPLYHHAIGAGER